MRLSRYPEPFDSDDYIFELKIYGHRLFEKVCDLDLEGIVATGGTRVRGR